jgi:Protein of unknown function (DUF3987)
MVPANVNEFVEGSGRNDKIYKLGRSLKAQGFSAEAAKASLSQTNQEFKQPLPAREISELIAHIITQPDRADFLPAQSGGPIAKAENWQEPLTLPGALPPVPAFDERLLPDALAPWLSDIAERTQAPLDFPGAGAIVALSSAIGRRCGIHPKRKDDWLVIPNLWGIIVGPPGALKSPMLHEVMKPLVRMEAAAREEHKTALEKQKLEDQVRNADRKKIQAQYLKQKNGLGREELAAQLKELESEPTTRRRFIVNDPTVEKLGIILNENPSGVLLSRDEMAGFLATMDREGHENDRAFYLEAWNGYSRYTYDRVQRGTLDIESTTISILGAITPGPLSRYLRETFTGASDDGLIQRFQISVYPDPPPAWENVDRWPDTAAKNREFWQFCQGYP